MFVEICHSRTRKVNQALFVILTYTGSNHLLRNRTAGVCWVLQNSTWSKDSTQGHLPVKASAKYITVDINSWCQAGFSSCFVSGCGMRRWLWSNDSESNLMQEKRKGHFSSYSFWVLPWREHFQIQKSMPSLVRDPHLIHTDADKMDSQNKSSCLRAWFVPNLIASITHAGVKISFNPQQLCEKQCICYPLIYG